jgi:RNA polymerase sigma-70 factor, ECF subfamily
LTQRTGERKRLLRVAHVREPAELGVTVPGWDEEFDAFFRSHARSLVGQAYVFTGDSAQAQDLAYEALTRAWERWGHVRDLESSLAWTRRVLYNLAVSEFRRAKVRARHSERLRVTEGPDVEALELADALRVLPELQRVAIVLHDAAGVSVREIARQLEVPEGTIRSWLTRGRATLAAQLRRHDEGGEKNAEL